MTPRHRAPNATHIHGVHLGRSCSVAVLAVIVAFGSIATAKAEPKEWDIEAYDGCIAKANDRYLNGTITSTQRDAEYRQCCAKTGGVLTATLGNTTCRAPGNDTEAEGHIGPRWLPDQTFTPAPEVAPAGDVTETFTPAP
jgi:hypothetical protein